jgi:putative ABC transport system permease protein
VGTATGRNEREQSRTGLVGRTIDGFRQDVRIGLRSWRRSPGLLCVAVLTLGLGVGSATALFGLVSSVLLKPLPYREPDRLAILKAERDYDGTRQPVSAAFSGRAVAAWPSDLRTFERTAFYAEGVIALATNQGQELIDQAVVSASFFDTIGAPLVTGRVLTAADDLQPVAVISTHLWQRLYASAADVVGKSITLNQVPFTIIGVADRGFQFPDRSTDVWIPAGLAQARNPRCCSFHAIGRLLPAASTAAATEEASAVTRALAKAVTALDGVRVQVVPLPEVVVGDARRALPVLTAAVGLLLVLACANVMNLLLVRQLSRAHETAVRRALGASRARLLAQALVEGTVLATAAAVTGVTLGAALLRGLQIWQPSGVPRLDAVRADGTVLVFGVFAAAVSTLVACLMPALRRDNMLGSLRAGQRGSTPGSPARAAMRTASIVQLALSVVLLVGATLLGRSLVALLSTDVGVSTEHVATASLNLSMNRTLTDDQQVALVDRVVARVTSLPDVTAAGVGAARPPDASRMVLTLNRPGDNSNTYRAVAVPATPGYFRALGVRLERGRVFTEQDTALAPPVVVMSLDAARHLFGNSDPIGQTVRLPSMRNGRNEAADMTVIGITANVKYSGLDKAADDLVYRPFAQQAWRSVFLVVRTTGDPDALASQLPREIAAVDRDIVVSDAMSMDDVLADVTAQPRFRTMLLVGFASIAVLIAAVGLYGLIAYSVSQRTREIGVRMALGAATWNIKRMVLREGTLLVTAGVVAGMTLAWVLSRLLGNLLYGIAATDPLSFLFAATVAVLAGLSASLIPAWRAARTNPVVVLRED